MRLCFCKNKGVPVCVCSWLNGFVMGVVTEGRLVEENVIDYENGERLSDWSM